MAAGLLDVTIDHLNLVLGNAAGHEHRVEPILRSALDLVAKRLQPDFDDPGHLESLAIAPMSLRLAAMSDEQAASEIADVILDALSLKLKA